MGELEDGARHGDEIDTPMRVEAPVLIGLEQGQVAGIDVARRRFQPPIAVFRQEGAEHHAVPVDDFRRDARIAAHVRRVGAVRSGERSNDAQKGKSRHDQKISGAHVPQQMGEPFQSSLRLRRL